MTIATKLNDAPIKQPPFTDANKTQWHPAWTMWLVGVVALIKELKTNVNAILAGARQSYRSTAQTITAGGGLVLPHGLTGITDPALVEVSVYLQCVTTEAGYAEGDLVVWNFATSSAGSRGVTVVTDATNLTVQYGSDANTFQLLNKTTGTGGVITNSKWKAIFIAKV